MFKIRWWGDGDLQEKRFFWDPATGEQLNSRLFDSNFSDHIYGWHYLRPIPQGILLSGLIAVLWFGLMISGLWLNRKKMKSQFLTWRQQRNERSYKSWLHTMIATVTLPFHVIYSVTGAFLGTTIISLPIILLIQFGGDRDKLFAEVLNTPLPNMAEEVSAHLPSLDPFLQKATDIVPESVIKDIYIERPFLNTARMHIHLDHEINGEAEVMFDLHESGDPIYVQQPGQATGGIALIHVAFELHFGTIAGPVVKGMFVLAGLALIMMAYLGYRMHILRIAKKQPVRSLIIERLFDGFALGFIPAVVVYGYTTRLLPWGISGRSGKEELIFHIAWLLIGIIVAIFGTNASRRRRWILGSFIVALGIPLADGFLYRAWPWQEQSWIVPSVGFINILIILASLGSLMYLIIAEKRRLIVSHEASQQSRYFNSQRYLTSPAPWMKLLCRDRE